jgi:NTE family protein
MAQPASVPAPRLPVPQAGDIALALGAGGARGLAHIVVLEALDELGIRPRIIAGSSIGAIIGAAYASGLPARALRAYVLASFKDRARVVSKLLGARVGKISDLLQRGMGNPVLVDGERILDLFWPEAVPDRFEDLKIPFIAVATDYHLRSALFLSAGPLTPAVAASMAIPGLVRPLTLNGTVLIDGGAVNPLPYDQLAASGHAVMAVDVGGGAFISDRRVPDPLEAMLGASQILMNALVQRMIERAPPTMLIRPPVDHFGGLDFFKVAEILAAAEPVRDQVKRAIETHLR